MTQFACIDTYPNQEITRNSDGGFTWSLNFADHFTMEFDSDGKYICQYQEDWYENGLTKIVLRDVEPLTIEQMANAT